MTINKSLLALALPFLLSAGCAMELGTTADGLTTETDNDFGINECGQSIQRWIGENEWPLDTIVAGDMEFSRDGLVEYMQTNPGFRADLVGEMAAVQLNLAVGIEIPEDILDGLVAADNWLMAPIFDGSEPPLVAIEDFTRIRGQKGLGSQRCYWTGSVVAEVVGGTKDIRDHIAKAPDGVVDLREGLHSR